MRTYHTIAPLTKAPPQQKGSLTGVPGARAFLRRGSRFLLRMSACCAAVLLSGCAGFKAPEYSASFQNVQKLRRVQSSLSLGEFTLEKPSLNSVALRMETMKCAHGTYADYLKGAAGAELKMAGKLRDAGSPELRAAIVENSYVIGPASGSGKIAARFTMYGDHGQIFNKLISGATTFPSSYFGSIAIPNAARSYTELVENLLGNLYSDPDFVNATQTNNTDEIITNR